MNGPRGSAGLRIVCLLIGAIVLVYAPALRSQFVNYDDPTYLDNPELKLGLSWDGFVTGFTTTYYPNWFPLVWWSFLVDHELYGADPRGYHLTNLLWHIGSTLLLWAALRRMTGADWPSALAAGLFAVHPLNVQVVAWVSERKGVLSTFFWMLALWGYARYVEQRSLGRYAVVGVALAVGLLAKQMLVTLPLVLLLLDYWPLRRWPETSPARLVGEKLPLLAIAFAGGLATIFAQARYAAVASLGDISLAARVKNALVTPLIYLRQACVPLDLAPFYPHPRDALPLSHAILAALILALITLLVLWQRRQRPYLAVGWFWYIITLLPVIGLLQVGSQGHADRYTYVPMIGIYIAAAWSVAELAFSWHLVPYLAASILALLAATARHEVHHWHDSATLWEHAIAVTGPNAVASHNLGAALMLSDQQAAYERFQDALRHHPNYPEAHLSLGLIWLDRGDNAQAADHLRKALTLPGLDRSLDAIAHYHLGLALMRQGQRAEAAQHFEEALRRNPADELARLNLGIIQKDRGDLIPAIANLREATRLDPGLIAAHYHLGLALLAQHDTPQALASLREAALRAERAGQFQMAREIEQQIARCERTP